MVMSSFSPVLNRISNFSSVALWNSNIREAINQGYAQKAVFLFRQLKLHGFVPNNFTFPFVAKACARLSDLKCAQIFHTHVVKSPFQYDVFVQTAMVDMYVKCSEVSDAYKLFEKMPAKDVASWNAMLVGFTQFGFVNRVFTLFGNMRFAGIQADAVTVMGLTQAALHTNNVRFIKAVHCIGIYTGINANVSVANTIIAAYSKCNDMELAEMVFYEIDMDVRTVVSWNSLIAGYANFEKYYKAVNSYKAMLHDGFRPDLGTIVGLLSSCVQPEALCQGTLIHSHGCQLGCDSNMSVINTLISMYSKCGDITSARILFDAMFSKSCVSWTAMISGYAERGNMDEALALFHAMEESGEKPDLVTVLSMISGCGQVGLFEIGQWIDSYASSNGLKENLVICNALIDMYAKCGSINYAQEIFYALPHKTVVSWTAMIAGCAFNGKFREALDLFFLMLDLGIKPNHITFLAVLQACVHGGLLEKGRECFAMMSQRYGINPGLDHYSCMADLFGRRGELTEALDLIHNMPVKPDAGIWGALLSACKIHHNVEIGEYVTHRLLELEPYKAVSFVEMANIYALAGKWDQVADMRIKMRFNRVRKSPGQSIVLVNGKSHIFTVEDRGHPEGLFIYAILDCLTLQSKEEEYSSNVQKTIEHELDLASVFSL